MLKHAILCAALAVALTAGGAGAEPVIHRAEACLDSLDEIGRAVSETEIETVILVVHGRQDTQRHLWEVRDYLIRQGVPEARLLVEAEGGAPDSRISVEIIGRKRAARTLAGKN